MDAIGANTWKEIVSSILSVVDGSESGSELRRALGDEKFLLTSRSSLGPAVDKLDQTLVEIYGIETSEKGESFNQLNQEPDGDLGMESLGSEQIHDATVAVEQPEKEVTTTMYRKRKSMTILRSTWQVEDKKKQLKNKIAKILNK